MIPSKTAQNVSLMIKFTLMIVSIFIRVATDIIAPYIFIYYHSVM